VGEIEVRDAGSKNWTAVDGQRLAPERWSVLELGARIDFGKSGSPWLLADAPPESDTAVASFDPGRCRFEFSEVQGSLILTLRQPEVQEESIPGRVAQLLKVLLAEGRMDREAGFEPPDCGWMTREELFDSMGDDGSVFSETVVSMWIKRARERLGPRVATLLEVRRGTKRSLGVVRCAVPGGGVALPDGTVVEAVEP
jgi:hypothetical protein